MNVNLYLPDDLGQEAKEAGLPLSQLLRAAVQQELERREVMSTSLADTDVHEIDFEDDDGRVITGRFTGVLICEEQRDGTCVYLTDDERVILHEPDKLRFCELDDPEKQLRDKLDESGYIDAMTALGITPVIDI